MTPTEPEKHIALPLAANGALAAVRLWAATLTGSGAVLAEALRSIIDISSQALMFSGLARATNPARNDVVFWSHVVPILLYGAAAGIATWEGIDRVIRPRLLNELPLAYAVLSISFAFQAVLAWAATPRADDPVGKAIKLETTIGLLCAGIALAGVAAADRGEVPGADGVAAILIGLLLALLAALMAIEVRNTPTGKPAPTPQQPAEPRFASTAANAADQRNSPVVPKRKSKHRRR